MKKNISLLLVALVAMVIGMTGCGKNSDSVDAADLLATVPSDATMVVTADLAGILEKAGCKITGSSIEPGDEVKKYVEKHGSDELRTMADLFFSGESGIDPTVAVLFQEGYDMYLTGNLADPGKFRNMVTDRMHEAFEKQGDIDMTPTVAVRSNQFWLLLNNNHRLSANEVGRFVSLAEGQSILSNSAAEALRTLDHDVKGWISVNGLLNTSQLDFSTKAMVRVALEASFVDTKAIEFEADMLNGKLVVNSMLLNSKGVIAKYLYPISKVDVDVIKSMGGNAEILAAIAIPDELVTQLINKYGSGKASTIFSVYLQMLKPLDGTIALVGCDDNKSFSGVVTTTGEGTSELSDIISQMSGASVRKDGKYLRFDEGERNQGPALKTLADDLKGAIAGLVMTGSMLEPRFGSDGKIGRVDFCLMPKGGGVVMRCEVISTETRRNIMVTILEALNSIEKPAVAETMEGELKPAI